MDYLLHIDTSSDTGSVAIGVDGKLLAHRSNSETRNHAATINLMIEDVLADAGINMEQLCGVVVCAGPGSYTGLRIGMATAKSICYALDKPLLLDNKLTLLAYQCSKKQPASQYISLLTAREKEYFIAVYDSDFNCILTPQHIIAESLNSVIKEAKTTALITNDTIVGSTLPLSNLQIEDSTNINFELWISYANEQFRCSNTINLGTAEPFYLKQVYTHK
jgi:tRNA threonylcarbamoyladenosine biosynthesis protein TsaB